jgi:hypothetical protein
MMMKLQNTHQKTVLFQSIDWILAFAGNRGKLIRVFHAQWDYVNEVNKTVITLSSKQTRFCGDD